jgi:hypothetical protein
MSSGTVFRLDPGLRPSAILNGALSQAETGSSWVAQLRTAEKATPPPIFKRR